jgi:tetratricopeptide (TPR) repeat protein
VTTVVILATMGNICSGGKPEPPGTNATQLYMEGALAWNRFVDKGRSSSDLTEAIKKCHEALSMDAAQNEHTQRNEILLMLIFALLEQSLDQASLEEIENHFSELEGWSDLEKADAHAIAARLASGYHELHNQAPSDSSLQRCLSSYTRARKYSDKLEHWAEVTSKMAALYRQGGQLEEAMEAINNAKSTCPTDQPNLLSSISVTKFMLHRDIYRSTGSSQELEYAVAEGEVALQVQFKMPPSQRAMLLTGVAQSIHTLSEAQPPEVDFEGRGRDAIQYARESVGLSVGKQRIDASIILADALSSRRIKPTIQELDEAIGLYRKAKDSDALSGDQQLLASLANAISFRCEEEEDPENGTTFQSAVDLYEKALMGSDDNRWNAHIVNNIAWTYVKKANSTKAEVDYKNARENYLKAAKFLEDAGTESDDPGEENDVGYYKGKADEIAKTIAMLKERGKDVSPRHTSERKPTPPTKRRSTPHGSL